MLVDGRLVMQNRRVLTMEKAQVLGEAEERTEKILIQAGIAADHVWPVVD